MNEMELRKERARLIKEARGILDKAADENRNLMTKEDKRFKELISKVEELNEEIGGGPTTFKDKGNRSESLSVLEDELTQSISDPIKPDPGGNSRKFDDLQPGELRVLNPDQRVSDFVQGATDQLSLQRVMRGMLLGDWRGAESEKRAMGEGTGLLGGYLVPDSLSALIIDLARNKSACLRAGAKTLQMNTPEVTIAKITSDPTGYWKAEHTEITESDAGFAPIKLKAQALACLCRVSLELLEDAQAFASTLESAIAQAIALELDRVGLLGTGVGEPLGIFETDDINTISKGANGGTLTNYDDFSNAVEDVADNNGAAGAVIYSPRTAGTLDRLKDTTNQPLQPPESFKSLTKLSTNQVPNDQTQGTKTTASCAFVGNFSQLIFGMRTQLVIEATRVAGTGTFSKMEALIRGYLRADVAVVRANHFTVVKGII